MVREILKMDGFRYISKSLLCTVLMNEDRIIRAKNLHNNTWFCLDSMQPFPLLLTQNLLLYIY